MLNRRRNCLSSKILSRNEKQMRQASKNCLPSILFFSPKIKTVKIGEMLHSKIVRRAFFSAELKNPAVKLRKNVCRAVFFCLKHQIVKRGKVLREKQSASMENKTFKPRKPIVKAYLRSLYDWR